MQLKDTLRASEMASDGTYSHIDLRGKVKLDSQQYFIEQTNKAIKKLDEDKITKTFTPMTNPKI